MIRVTGWPGKWQLRLDRALLDAVCRGWRQRAQWLLMLGADPDVTGWCDLGLVSALSAACIRQDDRLIGLLLAHGADEEGSPIEPTPPSALYALYQEG